VKICAVFLNNAYNLVTMTSLNLRYSFSFYLARQVCSSSMTS